MMLCWWWWCDNGSFRCTSIFTCNCLEAVDLLKWKMISWRQEQRQFEKRRQFECSLHNWSFCCACISYWSEYYVLFQSPPLMFGVGINEENNMVIGRWSWYKPLDFDELFCKQEGIFWWENMFPGTCRCHPSQDHWKNNNPGCIPI